MIKVRIKKLPVAKTGYQVDGALVNDIAPMGGADYNEYIGSPKLKATKHITAVPREIANLEAEGGETVYGDLNGDGFPEHQIISGPRHHEGGVPLNLPEDTFIFSDTGGMKIKDPELLDMFGKAGTKKAYTPAQLAKQYDIQKYREILEDPDSDRMDRKTAELMIKNFVIKLGCLALVQEAKKGFPQGIPKVAQPCLQAKGITEEQIAPNQEIALLAKQIEDRNAQNQKNSDETMESEYDDEQVAEAQDLNQGRPVAQPEPTMDSMQQPPEGMMLHGGIPRRLKRAQEGMQQMPPEMMQQEEAVDPQMQQILQEVAGALQQGADPMEIVASLLQSEIPPEAVVEIFLQLGATEEEAVGLVQQTIQQLQGGQQEQMMPPQEQMMQQQAPPMAMYGMEMGGYDMPFYDEYEEDLPEASQGANIKSIPKLDPLRKAQTGIIVEESIYSTPEEFERALWNASRKSEKTGEKVYVKRSTGKYDEFTGYSPDRPTETGSLDMTKWGTSDRGKTAAAQYHLLQESLKDPNSVAYKKLAEETIKILKNEKHFRGKTKPHVAVKDWEGRGLTMPTPAEINEAFLNHQKTNLMLEAHGISGAYFSDTGRGFASWNDQTITDGYYDEHGVKHDRTVQGIKSQLDAGAKLYDPRDPTGNTYITKDTPNVKQEVAKVQQYIKDTYGNNINDVATKLGVPLTVGANKRALQQASFHGLQMMINNLDPDAVNKYNEDEQYALRNFIGVPMQTGVADEHSVKGLFPALESHGKSAMISPIDDFGSDPSLGLYGNTTSKHLPGTTKFKAGFKPYEEVKEDCQCEDENLPNYGRLDPVTKECNPDLCKETPPEEECPCIKTDEEGNEVQIMQDRLPNGDCPPCEQEEVITVPQPPAEWWLQDTIKTTGAFGDLMGLKKYMPWSPDINLQKPRPAFQDPTRELAANAEQANIQTQGMAQFAGPQALSARSSSIQGQAAKNAADILAKYNNANVNIANQFELKGNDIANQEAMMKQAAASKLYDQTTIANQQFDNAKLAMRNNVRNYYTNAITNKWKTDALNQMYPNYRVSPASGGRMYYNPTQKTPSPGGATITRAQAYDQCRKMNPGAKDQTPCVNQIMASQQQGASNPGGMIGTMYSSVKNGGPVFNNGGYVYYNPYIDYDM